LIQRIITLGPLLDSPLLQYVSHFKSILIDLSHPQVERALTFWAEKVSTLQMIVDTKSKSGRGAAKSS